MTLFIPRHCHMLHTFPTKEQERKESIEIWKSWKMIAQWKCENAKGQFSSSSSASSSPSSFNFPHLLISVLWLRKLWSVHDALEPTNHVKYCVWPFDSSFITTFSLGLKPSVNQENSFSFWFILLLSPNHSKILTVQAPLFKPTTSWYSHWIGIKD